MSGGQSMPAQPAPSVVARAAESGAGADRGFAAEASGFGQRQALALVLPGHDGRGARMRDDWPLRSYLELGALAGSVPCARLHVKHVLWEWGLAELSDSVELLASELVTNAVRVSQSMENGSSVRLWLRSDKSRVLVLVWDGNPQSPVRIDVTEDAESGRGLMLVEAISDRWNWYRADSVDGKIVWAEISLTSPPELSRRLPRDYR